MAIIIGQPECYICHHLIEKHEAWTATWGVPFPPLHPLYPFCDAPLHFSCLENWPERKEFSAGYFTMFRDVNAESGHILAQGENWFLGCGPARQGEKPRYAHIVLAQWPIRLYLADWKGWEGFIERDFRGDLSGECLKNAEVVMEQVRQIAGSSQILDALHDAAQNRARAT